MSQGFPGQGQWSSGNPWGQPAPAWGAPHQFPGQQAQAQLPAGSQFPGQLPTQFPSPKPRGRLGPIILGALCVVALAMLGLVLYSLFGGPQYQNDEYEPPPAADVVPPLPDIKVAEVDAILTANPLYAQQLPVPVRCDLNNSDMDLTTASDDEVKAYINDVMGCTMRVWNPPFQATQRFELVRPVVNVYGESVTTPCGGGERDGPNASYCSANQQVYFSRALPQAHPNLAIVSQRRVIDGIMAHEFGHAMQGRNGTLLAFAYTARQQDRRSALELSRRVEVQADCFAGMYVQAVRQSIDLNETELNAIMDSMRLIGDDELAGKPNDPEVVGNHGHGQSRLYWFQTGLTTTDIGRCNTFTVPAEYVR